MKVMVASLKEGNFTLEQLEKLTLHGHVPIFLEFDHSREIGYVLTSEVIEEKLMCTINLYDEGGKNYSFTPSYEAHTNVLTCLGANPNLT